jgi:uncharacterized integral membrane protein (TIGR00698 family)
VTAPVNTARRLSLAGAAELAPGIALASGVAVIAVAVAPYVARILPVPAMVIVLFIGVALNTLAERAAFRHGIAFCVKTLLRWAVALLGIRIGLAEIIDLGPATAGVVTIAMVATIVAALAFTRLNGQTAWYGALAGAATAVCGASATLATATVLPNYPGKEADIAFVVVATNSLATLAMVLYPPLCSLLGFDAQTTGVMLGATIHDVAQVAGAGYAVSDEVGNTAVIVKLFRVFLLLPIVLGIGWYLTCTGITHGHARVPVPSSRWHSWRCVSSTARRLFHPLWCRSTHRSRRYWSSPRLGACSSRSVPWVSAPRYRPSPPSAGGT